MIHHLCSEAVGVFKVNLEKSPSGQIFLSLFLSRRRDIALLFCDMKKKKDIESDGGERKNKPSHFVHCSFVGGQKSASFLSLFLLVSFSLSFPVGLITILTTSEGVNHGDLPEISALRLHVSLYGR